MTTKYDILVPLQFFGIGDVIWEQTLVHRLANGKKILWPVEAQFVEGLNRAYPDISFVSIDDVGIDRDRRDEYFRRVHPPRPNGHPSLPGGEFVGASQTTSSATARYSSLKEGGESLVARVLPLRWSDSICGVPYHDVMKSKYMMYGMDWGIWKERAMWVRDAEKERELVERLGLPERFTLVNRLYGSASKLVAEMHFTSEHSVIEMRTMPGFSLFDWAGVIERASAIHTVSTSIIYMLELMELRAPCVHLYTRKPHETHFKNVDFLLKKHEYVFHL